MLDKKETRLRNNKAEPRWEKQELNCDVNASREKQICK